MDHFSYRGNELFAEDVSITEMARSVGTPFYCYSTATLTRHYQVFAESFSGMNAKICYAVKANSNIAVINTLAKLGSGADVVSQGEIRVAMKAGIAPKDIVFSGVAKTAEEMAYGLDQGIFQFNVESEPELMLLDQVARSKGKKASIAIRVNPDVNPITHSKISTGQKESKFGIPMEQALPLYAIAKTLVGIDVQGVSVHIGSQLTNLQPFAAAFERLAEFVRALREQGHDIRTLDLGGGLGIPYGHTEPPPVPSSYAEIVRDKTKGLDCQLIFEPGRLIVGNAGILVSKVIYVKKGSNRLFLILDAGMNDLIRPTLYDAYHAIVPVKVREDTKTELMDIVGPVCETGDIFAEQRLLKVPQPDDLMVFRSAGAYGAVMSGTYNARLLVPEVLVNGSKFSIVRRRPSYEEQMQLEQLPNF
jgi:diaminopimelate decarboxylase